MSTEELTASLLAVGEARARVVRKMGALLKSLEIAEVSRVARDVLTWRRKDNNELLKPTSQLSYFTALIVAATTMSGLPFGRDPILRRIEKAIKSAQLLHVRKQALPLAWADLLSILSNSDIKRDLRHTIRFLWLLGMRVGDLKHLRRADFSWQSGPDGPILLVRCRGFKGQTPGSRSYWRFLPLQGQPASFVRFLMEASRGLATERVSTASWDDVVRALRTTRPYYTAHSIRRGVATFLADRGFSVTAIRDHLGHASVRSTRQYVQPKVGQPDVRRRTRIALGAWPTH